MANSDKPVYLVYRNCEQDWEPNTLIGAYAVYDDAMEAMRRGIRMSHSEGEVWKVVEFRGTVSNVVARDTVLDMSDWGV